MTIQSVKRGTSVLFSFFGELDQYAADGARGEIENKILKGDVQIVIFDFSHLSFMDSSGIGVLVGAYKNILAFGGKAYLFGGGESIRKIILLAGLDRRMPFLPVLPKAFMEGENHE